MDGTNACLKTGWVTASDFHDDVIICDSLSSLSHSSPLPSCPPASLCPCRPPAGPGLPPARSLRLGDDRRPHGPPGNARALDARLQARLPSGHRGMGERRGGGGERGRGGGLEVVLSADAHGPDPCLSPFTNIPLGIATSLVSCINLLCLPSF